jgi:hypothetical protein
MPTITISRGGGWADRFRPYTIIIDGEHRDQIRPNQSRSYEVSFGQHHVQLLAGLLYGSPVLRVHVDARGVTLACGSNKKLSSALFQMARPDSTVWLRPASP